MTMPPRAELETLKRLELIYDASRGGRDEVMPTDVLGQEFDNRQDLYPWLRRQEDDGLVVLSEMVVPRVMLTRKGVKLVEEARAQRDDPRWRRREARQRILDWLDRAGGVGRAMSPDSFLGHPLASLHGSVISKKELENAIEYLIERRLVSGLRAMGGYVSVQLTHLGQEFLDNYAGDLDAYLNPRASGGNTTIIHGNVNALAQGSNASAIVFTGPASDEISVLVQAIRELLELTPDLGDEQAEQVRSELLVLETSREPGTIKKSLGVIGNIGQGAAGSGLWQAIWHYAARLVDAVGA